MSESSEAYEEGLEALDSGDPVLAMQSFTEAIIEDGSAWEPYYARAYVFMQDAEDLDEEVLELVAADLDRALEINGAASDAAALRAEVALRQGEPEEAVRYLLMAFGRSTQQTEVRRRLAETLHGLLGDVESGRGTEEADTGLCDRLDRMLEVSTLPAVVRDGLRAEVLAARSHRWQLAGDSARSLADLQLLAGLVPDHPRLPATLPAARPRDTGAVGPASQEPAFDTVGGIDGADSFSSELRKIFDVYLGDPDVGETRRRLAEFGQPATRSLLLFGPSGCGKTYVVRAFAGEYRRRHGRELPLFRLRMEEIYGKYVGESESRLAEAFDRALNAQPSLLFCDEIDGLGMNRESISQDFRQEFAGHFLQQVDRLKEQNAALLFFGCTNRLWSVDLALLRRFDRVIPVELPNESTRVEIFRIHLARVAQRLCSPDIDVAALARHSHGLTPGDIQKSVSRAVDNLLVGSDGGADAVLGQEALMRALDEEKKGQGRMHLQQWVRESRAALTRIGQDTMATDLDRRYGPYLDPLSAERQNGVVPLDAWTEEPSLDLSFLRQLGG
ncbi:ATP-binding protein [Kitasatospora sp. NPDC004723]|uniref:ATP-binding protein n=1 Tax=Kitasatospora sp. NPDC004723 TaxID=3154288 RepID=UPI0033B60423